MKNFLLAITILSVACVSFAQDVAVVYNSGLPVTTAGAAVVEIRYDGVDFFDVYDLDSAGINTLITAITDESYHRIFVFIDTASVFVEYYLPDNIYDTLLTKLYGDETDDIEPDTDLEYLASTASQTKAEVVWDDLYPNFTEPLIIQYLGFDEFSGTRSLAQYASTDSTLVDTLTTNVVDEFIGYNIYIIYGTGYGQVREVYDNTADVFFVTPDWTTNPSKTSRFVVKKEAEENENFYDMYSLLYVMTYLGDLTDNTTIKNWHKLMDNKYNINKGNVYRTTFQDLDYLEDTVLAGGKIIYDFVLTGVTSLP